MKEKIKIKMGFKIAWIIIRIFLLAITCVLTIMFALMILSSVEVDRIKSCNIIVEAEIVDVSGKSSSTFASSGIEWDLIYSYKDENYEYRGKILADTTDEEARAQIGKKINIYIDGKGKSTDTGYHRPPWQAVLLSLCMLTLFLLLLMYKKIFKYFKNRRKSV